MKRALILMVIFVCAVSPSLLAGCGSAGGSAEAEGGNGQAAGADETGQGTGEGQAELTDEEGKKITVEEAEEEGDSHKVIIEGESGQESTVEVQEQAPSEEALGAPIYPGALLVEGSSVTGKTTSPDGKEISVTGADFVSEDDIAKVVDWYKGRLGTPMASAPETATWMKQDEEGSIVTVIAEIYGDQVKITIRKVVGDIGIEL